jgi:GNAT superfamily N-acetyltransferase
VERDFIIRELFSEADIRAAHPLVRELRPHVETPEMLLELFRRQQAEGYTLIGGFAGDQLVALAGYRLTCTLARGPHLFVDDLVTTESTRGQGLGKIMIDQLRRIARDAGLKRVHLDSRDTAVGFYEKVGFILATSKPCSIEA